MIEKNLHPKKPDIRIGIDPDAERSGYAVFDKRDKSLELRTLPFWDVIYELELYMVPVHVVIEAGWLIEVSNWHRGKRDKKTGAFIPYSTGTREKISKGVGQNHMVGILFEQYCKLHDISYELKKPLGKIDAKMFTKITGYKGRTNQEVRDAAMLVYDV